MINEEVSLISQTAIHVTVDHGMFEREKESNLFLFSLKKVEDCRNTFRFVTDLWMTWITGAMTKGMVKTY
jgi:hypothetical protein